MEPSNPLGPIRPNRNHRQSLRIFWSSSMTLETFIVIGIILAMIPVALADFTDDKQ
jgi:hypothetical protein